jgi:hypothetical protein
MAMKKGRRTRKLRHLARLAAYNSEGALVFEQDIPLGKYYEESQELIDSDEFRNQRGIVRVVGKLYDDEGKLYQEFENSYGLTGEYLHGRTHYADGTVAED